MKKRNRLIIVIIALFVLVVGLGVGFLLYINKVNNMTTPYFLASDNNEITLNGEDNISISLPRGTKVDIKNKAVEIDNQEYRQFVYEDKTYYVLQQFLELDRKDCVREKQLYTLRNHVLTSSYDTYKISDYLFKNTKVDISGYHELLDDGSVDYYYVNNTGYISSKYLAHEYYDTSLDSSIYSDCFFRSGGDPTKIDYYAKEKLDFKNNKMPDVVKALYINAEAICDTDDYVEIARKTSGINAFVVDIKDCYIDTQLAYNSNVAFDYAPSTSNIVNTYETYKENVKKLKDAGYYLIGRITAFKDDAFANDNPDEALMYNGHLYEYGFVKWPSIFSRKMWEYDLALAYEAAIDMGFNEIQFDYVRLPEDTEDVELRNVYDESHIEAITEFLRYACEYLHNIDVYVSADVFGETSGDDYTYFSAWSTSYGQFWPAISNVVDAISSMPYPDHFSSYSFDIPEPWYDVYDLMYRWGKATKYAQENTYDQAKCRTWIMAQSSDVYDVEYSPDFIADQIQGLKDAGVFDGYLTWNAASSEYRYNLYADVLD